MENAGKVCWESVLDFRSLREKRRGEGRGGEGSIFVAVIVPYARMLEKESTTIIVMMMIVMMMITMMIIIKL